MTSNTPRIAPQRLDGQSVYVVDAHSLIYQVFHVMGDMMSPSGQPVGAIHGFIRDMLQILEQKRPNYLFCAFDYPGGVTFRHDLFSAYKQHREAMPTDLRPQIAQIQCMLAALGIPSVQAENYEADDVLALFAREVEALGGTCYLVTGDKDCRQLLTEHVHIYNIRKDQVFDTAALWDEWGVRPDQVVDFQALVGDSVDNIPGVPLIGPKLARELLQKYGTLEEVLNHADEVGGKKRRENLVQFREQALLSRELVKLTPEVPLTIDWAAGRVGGVDRQQSLELCREFGFRRLAEQISGLTVQEAPPSWVTDYRLIASEAELLELLARLREAGRFALDTETTSASPRRAEVVGFSFAWGEGQACYVPVRAPAGDPQLPEQFVLQQLKPLLEDPTLEKVGQNLKYERVVLRGLGIELRGIGFDAMVADYLLEAGERNHGLDDLALRYLNHQTIKIKDLIGSGRQQKRMDEVPVELVKDYAAEDADVPFRLAAILPKRLRDLKLEKLYHDLEMPLIEVLAEMEYNGIRVDVERLAELSARYQARMDELQLEIHHLAGEPFHIDSRLQLCEVLFKRLGLPILKRTKTGPSTDAEVLAELAQQHALPAKVLEYRQYGKLLGTYIDALPALVHPQTGRVHTSFKQDVAATGRLSSSDPNLQNIPIRTREGRDIRSAFLPGSSDWQLVTADYSQIELRVLAHYSGDPALQGAFAEGRDIHSQVASEVYGVPLEQVTPDMRRSAKAVNFGVIYGQSPFGLAKALHIPKDEAAQFIDAYFARYEGVDKFMTQVLEDCRRNGYVSTVLGRRRTVLGVRDPSRVGTSRQRNLPERIAINTVIQGSAADLIKQAMINVFGRMQREKLQARMLLQIHDELVFEAPPSELAALLSLVREEMTAAGRLNVPLQVDIKTGANWAECELTE